MTVLFVTNIPTDIGLTASMNDTAATGRDTNYSPQSINQPNSTPATINIGSYTGDLWFHWREYMPSAPTLAGAAGSWIQFYDASNNLVAEVNKITGDTTQTMRARAYGSATVAGLTYAYSSGTITIDVKLTIGTSGNPIVIEFYVNGTLVSTATATNSGTVKGLITKIIFPTFTATNKTEIIITANEDPRLWRLSTLVPASAGSDTSMTGAFGNLADVDLATGCIGTANGQRSSWNPSTYAGAASPTGIRGVFLKAKVGKSGTSLTKLNQYLKISATNYDGADQTIVNDSLMEEFTNNPNTAAAWAVAGLTAQFGLKAVT